MDDKRAGSAPALLFARPRGMNALPPRALTHHKGLTMDRRLLILTCAFALIPPCVAQAQHRDVDAACVMPAPPRKQSATFPVRLDIHGDDARAVGSGVVTLSHADGTGTVTLDCAKPRVLMRLAPGSYVATVDMTAGPTRTLQFRVSASQGTKTLMLRFPPSVPELTAR